MAKNMKTHMYIYIYIGIYVGERNGNPLQYLGLGNHMDKV